MPHRANENNKTRLWNRKKTATRGLTSKVNMANNLVHALNVMYVMESQALQLTATIRPIDNAARLCYYPMYFATWFVGLNSLVQRV